MPIQQKNTDCQNTIDLSTISNQEVRLTISMFLSLKTLIDSHIDEYIACLNKDDNILEIKQTSRVLLDDCSLLRDLLRYHDNQL